MNVELHVAVVVDGEHVGSTMVTAGPVSPMHKMLTDATLSEVNFQVGRILRAAAPDGG